MNSKRIYFLMLGAIGLLGVLLIATVFFGDKMLKKQGDRLTSLKLDNAVIENQQTALVLAKRDIEKYAELESIAKQIVPQDKDQARAVREIVSLAKESGVNISSISFPASNLGQSQPKAQPPAEGDSSTTTTTTPAPSISQAKPIESIKGVYQLDITVVSDTIQPMTYDQFISFLDKLERNRRTAHVSQIVIQPNTLNRALLSFNLTVTVYVKP